ncbi:MAG: DEAD/DEAH box helicase family protein [candidate division WOR-3 bacterium]
MDYILRIRVNKGTQPLAVALIEAKRSNDPPDRGLEQARKYARLNNVPFLYSSNGYLFVEYDSFTGITSKAKSIEYFPSPKELRERYEKGMGFSLNDDIAKPLLVPYPGGESKRRYYQDAAIRAILEHIARGKKRALLHLATGSGKTFIAVHLLKKIADAGQLRRALFLCDRDELRNQALKAFQEVFGSDAAAVSTSNPQKNARILIATYQTLNIHDENGDAKFLLENYPENYFSHIIIDECHRSAWGKWSIVLTRNSNAIQVGLTATPRSFEGGTPAERKEDEEITANNLQYFGEPVYEYSVAQGIADGYLPACEIIQRMTSLDPNGVRKEDIERLGAKDPITGKPILFLESRDYTAQEFENNIMLPDRVKVMCKDLFDLLLETGGPEQKTVIFCVRDTHADAVATEMNNLYADWCAKNGKKRADVYAFKCTAESGGSDYIPDFRGLETSHFIATTVDLITTGVDVPCLRNVVFFRYIQSPIAFHQMMGRGLRIDEKTGKFMFRVYDYTNATRLLGKGFEVKPAPERREPGPSDHEPPRPILVEGFDNVYILPGGGKYILAEVDGKLSKLTIEEYKQRIAEKIVEEAKDFEDFRNKWMNPKERESLLGGLPEGGRSVSTIQKLAGQGDYDPYDLLAEIGYGLAPKTRAERVSAFFYKNKDWLESLPDNTRNAVVALVNQFAVGGTEELENPKVFEVATVVKAGGLPALRAIGEPREIIEEIKRRLFEP